MKRITPVLLSVGLCLILLGGTIGTIAWFNGAVGYQGNFLNIGLGTISLKETAPDSGSKTEVRNVGGKNYESKHYDLADLGSFDKVIIDIGMAETILSQDDEKGFVQSQDFPEGKFKCSVTDNTLHIQEEGSYNQGITINQPKRKLTIALPKDVPLQNVALDLGVGEVKLNQLTADYISIDGGVGSLDAKDIITQKLEVSGGVGDVKITGLECTEYLSASCGVGLTDITGTVQGGADFEGGVGDLRFNGELLGNFSVDSGTGEVDMTLTGNADDYYFSLDTGVGSVRINGEKIKHDQNSYGSSSAPYRADLSCGVGDLEVSFQ